MVTKKNTTRAKKRKNRDGSHFRIRIRAYEPKILDSSVKQILETAVRFEVKAIGPIPLPTKIKKFSVNRSPFIFKTSQDQYEMRIHTRILEIANPSPQLVEALSNLSLPVGVSIEIQTI